MVVTDRPRRTRDFRRGQAIFVFVAAFTMIAGILGLVLDGGHIFLEKRRAQAAADAGAAGAVQEMRRGNPGNPGNKIARGNSDSSFTGALYFPSEHLDWAGNPSSIVSWGMVVANTLNISGTADTQVINPPTESQAPKTYRMMFSE